ncbi:phosphotransferase family protein [Micromonospora chersina]|uniref:phosphotransferase family protein n=1 Tax=Micromonospora chersina TaxID=47854 RepID=UPI003C99CDED
MTARTLPDPPGLDLARLAGWFASSVPGAAGLSTARLIAGGKSNLTYEVGDGRTTWIVRRPPLGHVLSTAHDMAREYRVMSALHATDVPVPATYALCADAGVLGAPFYVMERVTGTAYRQAAELERLGPERTRAISTRLVDTLATLHAVDPAAVGLADFGRPEGFLARQVRRWRKQLDASYCRDLPAADELYARLAADVPADPAPGIVHGDYRLDNVLVDDGDRLAAVIDWEMATLGDPLTDLALLVLYQRLGRIVGAAVAEASSAPGFLTEDEILDRYATARGRALPPLGFHLGLAAFKLAVILEGIHVRHLRGQTVGAGFAHVGEVTELLLDAGLTYLKEH